MFFDIYVKEGLSTVITVSDVKTIVDTIKSLIYGMFVIINVYKYEKTACSNFPATKYLERNEALFKIDIICICMEMPDHPMKNAIKGRLHINVFW